MSELSTTGETRRRRAARRPSGDAIALRNERYREIINPLTPARVFSTDQVEYIHQASLTLLQQRGLRVLSERARSRFAQAGADVDGETRIVRLDAGLVTQTLASAPRSIRIIALKEDSSVTVGGQRILEPISSAP